jgi:LmbE family N-acetylglucosaminyl deacetylase/CheY-like chemotaxis protein
MTSTEDDGLPGRILLVEDDPVAAYFALHVLGKRGGFDVTHTPDPAVALRHVSSADWDLVLTDAELPGMTGLEFLAALRRLSPDLPVAVITAHESADIAIRELRKQSDEFLQKPVRPDRLLAAAASLVANGRKARLVPGQESVLAIGAHPGDAETGAGGALLAHRGLGQKVSILTLTGGVSMARVASGGVASSGLAGEGVASAGLTSAGLAGQRMTGARPGESAMAALVLGAALFLEDLQATRIEAGGPTADVIERVIEAVRPTVIYTHSLHDAHQDHRNTHQAAMLAAQEVGRVYCFPSPDDATAGFRPTRFVTIDEQVERKLLAIRAFTSPGQAHARLDPDQAESAARHWSRSGGGRYAEAFEVIREPAAGRSQPVPRD